jgi:hypothetical protein
MDAVRLLGPSSGDYLAVVESLFQATGLIHPMAMLRQAVFAVVAMAGLSSQTPLARWRNETHFGPLQFKRGGTFQVSIFEDLHFAESMRCFSFPTSTERAQQC